MFTVKDPERLVLELETDELPPALTELQAKVAPEDPYIKGLRVARNRPGVIRLVLDHQANQDRFTGPAEGQGFDRRSTTTGVRPRKRCR